MILRIYRYSNRGLMFEDYYDPQTILGIVDSYDNRDFVAVEMVTGAFACASQEDRLFAYLRDLIVYIKDTLCLDNPHIVQTQRGMIIWIFRKQWVDARPAAKLAAFYLLELEKAEEKGAKEVPPFDPWR